MKENELVIYSVNLAIEIVEYYKWLIDTKKEFVMSKQILRSGTSIGANIHEAQYAVSKADFISKMQIALKECYESEYWLELLNRTGYIPDEQYKPIQNDCGAIRRMLITSINTVKKNTK